MNLSKRQLWLFGAIAIGALILLTLLAAPMNRRLNSGSTYGRAPDGYGAWYAFMIDRGTPVQRWQKPFGDLAKSEEFPPPMTLLRIYGQLSLLPLSEEEQDWVERGNTLVILGVLQPVTKAPFSTQHNAAAGRVQIDTQRRETGTARRLLGDRFGAVVWERRFGKGRAVFATTPDLAANAYQDFRGNYEFLAQLVTQLGAGEKRPRQDASSPGIDLRQSAPQTPKSGALATPEASSTKARPQLPKPVWVDEYIHGYKDADSPEDEDADNPERKVGQTLWRYLAKTPLFLAFVQGFILLLVAIWASNRRFGKPLTLATPVVDNSEAYIGALAGVLQKANSSELILEVVGKDEQAQLQNALGLGQVPLDHRSLLDAWVEQTGRPARELEQLLQFSSQNRRASERDLLAWLGKWEEIHRHLPSDRTDSQYERN